MVSLDSFPRPSLAVDTAVLTVTDAGRFGVLLLSGADGAPARLPGTFLHEGEMLVDAVLRSLREKADVRGLAPEQLHVFDALDRDDRGRVLSVAHVDVVRASSLPARAWIVPVDEMPRLAFDHDRIVAFAVAALRKSYREHPDPAALLEDAFTLSELRGVHESVLEERLLPDTFRRTMLPHLHATGALSREGRGRPAELYRRV